MNGFHVMAVILALGPMIFGVKTRSEWAGAVYLIAIFALSGVFLWAGFQV